MTRQERRRKEREMMKQNKKMIGKEKLLNKDFSKFPVTEEQKRVAEKYENVKMILRFTSDGRSWSIWHMGSRSPLGKVSRFEPDKSDQTKFNCIVDDVGYTLFSKPQNDEQEICYKDFFYLESPIYFMKKNEAILYSINNRNELEQLNSIFYTDVPINPNWESSDIVSYQDSIEYPYSAPISFEQQRIHFRFLFNKYLFHIADGKKSFIYNTDQKFCEIIEKTEAIKRGLGMNKYFDCGNGYVFIEIDKTNEYYNDLKEFVEEIDSF